MCVTDRLLTPSKITAWLDCAHFLSLKHQVEDGLIAQPPSAFGSFAQLLAEKGLQHEADCLAEYEAAGQADSAHPGPRQGRGVRRLGRTRRQSVRRSATTSSTRCRSSTTACAASPTFCVRVDDDAGACRYEPVDAKLARVEAKPGHVLQLCFYADAIEAVTGIRPKRMHLWLGSGQMESLGGRRVRALLAPHPEPSSPTCWTTSAPQAATVPSRATTARSASSSTCATEQWRGEDSLIYVAGIRTLDRRVLETAGVSPWPRSPGAQTAVEGVRPERLHAPGRPGNAAGRGAAAARTSHRRSSSSSAGDDPMWGRGLELLPEPDDGRCLPRLRGPPVLARRCRAVLPVRVDRSATRRPLGATRRGGRTTSTRRQQPLGTLIDFLAEPARAYPGMHVYHYNHTERSSLERLAATTASARRR